MDQALRIVAEKRRCADEARMALHDHPLWTITELRALIKPAPHAARELTDALERHQRSDYYAYVLSAQRSAGKKPKSTKASSPSRKYQKSTYSSTFPSSSHDQLRQAKAEHERILEQGRKLLEADATMTLAQLRRELQPVPRTNPAVQEIFQQVRKTREKLEMEISGSAALTEERRIIIRGWALLQEDPEMSLEQLRDAIDPVPHNHEAIMELRERFHAYGEPSPEPWLTERENNARVLREQTLALKGAVATKYSAPVRPLKVDAAPTPQAEVQPESSLAPERMDWRAQAERRQQDGAKDLVQQMSLYSNQTLLILADLLKPSQQNLADAAREALARRGVLVPKRFTREEEGQDQDRTYYQLVQRKPFKPQLSRPEWVISTAMRELVERYAAGEMVEDLTRQAKVSEKSLRNAIAVISYEQARDLKQESVLSKRALRRGKKVQPRAVSEKFPVDPDDLVQSYRQGHTVQDMAVDYSLPPELIDGLLEQVLAADPSLQDQHVGAFRIRWAQQMPDQVQEWLRANPNGDANSALKNIIHYPEDEQALLDYLHRHGSEAIKFGAMLIQRAIAGETVAVLSQDLKMPGHHVLKAMRTAHPGFSVLKSRNEIKERELAARRQDLLSRAQVVLADRLVISRQEVAELLGCSATDVNWLRRQGLGVQILYVQDHAQKKFSDEDLVAAVQEVAARAHVTLLTSPVYDRLRTAEQPTSMTIVVRLGWNETLRRAGLEVGGGKTRGRKPKPESQILRDVWTYLAQGPVATVDDYNRWAALHPGVLTYGAMRARIGSWNEIVALAQQEGTTE